MVSDVRNELKGANPDWSFLQSPEYKIEVREEIISITEGRTIRPSIEISAAAFDRFSCHLDGKVEAAVWVS